MPSLDIISVNLWQILVSLCNLLILYWILKRFLYKPVKDMVAKRKEQLQAQYDEAAQAQEKAGENQAQWERKLAGAQAEADSLVKTAQVRAAKSSDKIVAEAKDRADSILRAGPAGCGAGAQKSPGTDAAGDCGCVCLPDGEAPGAGDSAVRP